MSFLRARSYFGRWLDRRASHKIIKGSKCSKKIPKWEGSREDYRERQRRGRLSSARPGLGRGRLFLSCASPGVVLCAACLLHTDLTSHELAETSAERQQSRPARQAACHCDYWLGEATAAQPRLSSPSAYPAHPAQQAPHRRQLWPSANSRMRVHGANGVVQPVRLRESPKSASQMLSSPATPPMVASLREPSEPSGHGHHRAVLLLCSTSSCHSAKACMDLLQFKLHHRPA
jgi:hypothetical protein